MAFDFNKIKDGVSKTYDKSIEGIKNTFRRNDDMPKQKKKKKSLLEIMGFEKPVGRKKRPIKKSTAAKSGSTTGNNSGKHKTVRTVKLRKSHRRVVIGRILWIAFIIGLVFLGIFAYRLTNDFIHDRADTDIPALIGELNETNSFKINIPIGSRTSDIAQILIENGIISDKNVMGFTYFELYSRLMGNDGGYKSGNHWINSSIDYDNPVGYDMLIHILSQNPIPNPTAKIFFAEGLTFKQTIERFIEEEFLDPDRFTEVCNTYEFDYEFMEEIPKNGRYNRLEGYLFPDTYIFDKTKPEEEAIDKMLQNFENKFKDAYRDRLEVLGMTMDEIIIIASLIEREAQVDDERDVISGVIYNRLHSSD
ncbi:MAG: endolytic transglycosylase MltG, partial [Clostridia bacterium]|nr:endolytic transglycosylase MltG [Clostridia bacterium]